MIEVELPKSLNARSLGELNQLIKAYKGVLHMPYGSLGSRKVRVARFGIEADAMLFKQSIDAAS